MVCGRPLVYFGRTESRVCSICGKEKPAAEFTRERFGVELPVSRHACEFTGMNKECLKERCPFYSGE